MRHGRQSGRAGTSLLAVSIVLATSLGLLADRSIASRSAPRAGPGIHKIRHVIVIMQENRSFDSYFGTFPGADGIPKNVCIPDPQKPGTCVRPYADHADINGGGPHAATDSSADIHGGKMDGFVGQAQSGSSEYYHHTESPRKNLPAINDTR